MSGAPAVEVNSTLSREQICANRVKTYKLLYAAFKYGTHDAFKEHMENNPVTPYFSDSLSYGMRLVVEKIRTMADIAPTLSILLQHGAKWDRDDLQLPSKKTPYHVICQSHGDHHELLRLMIKQIGRTLVNAKDCEFHTALAYAVHYSNVKCLEVLIENGGEVDPIYNTNIGELKGMNTSIMSPIIDSIALLQSDNFHSPNIMMDIFDLLLDSGAKVNKRSQSARRTPIMHAAVFGRVKCVRKLIMKGAKLYLTDRTGCTVWSLAARFGGVDMLKCLLEDGNIDKDSFDRHGLSALHWAIKSDNIEAVRYLLHIGVKITTFVPNEYAEPCRLCGKILPCHSMKQNQLKFDSYMLAISMNKPEVLKLMEGHDCQLCKSDKALSYAVCMNSVEVLEYLLCNHKYSLNFEYIEDYDDSMKCDSHQTLLMKACLLRSEKAVKLLLEHGANPNTESCKEACPSVIFVAIHEGLVEAIALFIRSGVNINQKAVSTCNSFGSALFEIAVSCNNFYAAAMLLVFGCTGGMYSLDKSIKVKDGITHEQQGFLKKRGVHKNIVLSLQQRCRMVILNHLCPQAHKKITALPLPAQLIKYLSIPELDDIVKAFMSNPLGIY